MHLFIYTKCTWAATSAPSKNEKYDKMSEGMN